MGSSSRQKLFEELVAVITSCPKANESVGETIERELSVRIT